MYAWYRRLCLAGLLLALCVASLGAYVRLTDAGLGCPDWPGCYGELVLPRGEAERSAAQAAFPDRPIDPGKAWREMLHRYLAALLGLVIVGIAALAWLNRRDPRQLVVLPLALLALVVFQGILGMWTVTLLLKPLVVMGHLLGGLATTALLFWLVLENRRGRSSAAPRYSAAALAGLAVLICQIALGGWTSANYAALACTDLPTCGGEWFPSRADFAEGFVLWRGLGVDYEGGVLETPARVAIHYTHRIGALIVTAVLGFLGLRYLRAAHPARRRAAALLLTALAVQLAIGIGIVWYGLPLLPATLHNTGAALLLLATLNLNHAILRLPQR